MTEKYIPHEGCITVSITIHFISSPYSSVPMMLIKNINIICTIVSSDEVECKGGLFFIYI